jgi:hypothetical protein
MWLSIQNLPVVKQSHDNVIREFFWEAEEDLENSQSG